MNLMIALAVEFTAAVVGAVVVVAPDTAELPPILGTMALIKVLAMFSKGLKRATPSAILQSLSNSPSLLAPRRLL